MPLSERWSQSIALSARFLVVATLGASAAGCAGMLSGLEYVYAEGPLDSSPNKLAFAPCPPGTKATGGGAYISPQVNELALIRSEPGGGGNGWIAHASEVSPYAGNWKVAATAICTKVAP
jgi:hypothetical protein